MRTTLRTPRPGSTAKRCNQAPSRSGESFTQTFDTAGTYEYFCEFHPNMKGSIVVE